jgi:hypothetical protein
MRSPLRRRYAVVIFARDGTGTPRVHSKYFLRDEAEHAARARANEMVQAVAARVDQLDEFMTWHRDWASARVAI